LPTSSTLCSGSAAQSWSSRAGARTAADISMAEVVRALEGEIAPIECITADPERGLVCVREGELGHDPCPTKLLWTRVQGSIVRTLNDMTLADLVRPPRKTKQTETVTA
jgi:DNA-binding IscR family transcriptional regulator